MHPQDTARPAQQVEPDIISLGADASPSSPRPPRPWPRWLIEPVLLALGLGAILFAGHFNNPSAPTSARQHPVVAAESAKPSISASRDSPMVVAGTFARPGEWLIVLAYRDSRFCGPAEVRFDGLPTENRPLAEHTLTPTDHLVLRVQIPATATAGSHELELFGPLPGGPPHPICADTPEHQGPLGRAPVTVLPR